MSEWRPIVYDYNNTNIYWPEDKDWLWLYNGTEKEIVEGYCIGMNFYHEGCRDKWEELTHWMEYVDGNKPPEPPNK